MQQNHEISVKDLIQNTISQLQAFKKKLRARKKMVPLPLPTSEEWETLSKIITVFNEIVDPYNLIAPNSYTKVCVLKEESTAITNLVSNNNEIYFEKIIFPCELALSHIHLALILNELYPYFILLSKGFILDLMICFDKDTHICSILRKDIGNLSSLYSLYKTIGDLETIDTLIKLGKPECSLATLLDFVKHKKIGCDGIKQTLIDSLYENVIYMQKVDCIHGNICPQAFIFDASGKLSFNDFSTFFSLEHDEGLEFTKTDLGEIEISPRGNFPYYHPIIQDAFSAGKRIVVFKDPFDIDRYSVEMLILHINYNMSKTEKQVDKKTFFAEFINYCSEVLRKQINEMEETTLTVAHAYNNFFHFDNKIANDKEVPKEEIKSNNL